MKSLDDFTEIHKGKRAFIACNGLSLNDIPMEKLRGEIVFGLNRGYMKDGLPITYLVVMVPIVVEQWGDEIIKVPCDTLFTNLLDTPHTCKINFGGKEFCTDLRKTIHRGHTVTYPTMQLAFRMGFEKVYCIGLDHSFKYDNTVKDKSHHRAVITKGEDLNHFDSDYFGDGAKWLPYSPKMVEVNYKLATKAFYENGRELWNASTKTALSEKIIPRIDFNSIWEGEI